MPRGYSIIIIVPLGISSLFYGGHSRHSIRYCSCNEVIDSGVLGIRLYDCMQIFIYNHNRLLSSV